MNALELVVASLEQCAELDIDLTPAIYQTFFDRCSDALPLMGHSDEYMRGRMAAQVFEILMDDSHFGEGGYLGWEVDAHCNDYGVDPAMYDDLFAAVKSAVKEAISDGWNSDFDTAWDQRIKHVLAEISRLH
jgi:hypothetical protein